MKFNNIPKRYGGKTYQSTLEANYAAHLDLLKRVKEIQSYEQQKVFRLDINGHHIANYIADFVVIGKHGREEIHEVKGIELAPFKLKWKMMKALYPEYHYELIKRGDF
jgi:hypothetical protein